MNSSRRTVCGTALALTLAFGTATAPAAASVPGPETPPAQGENVPGHGGEQTRVEAGVTIKRDDYGVPHVYSDTLEGLYTGYGYAVAQDRLFQMEMAKRSVLGTSAEVVGAEGLDNDKRSRATLAPGSIRQQIDALSDEDRSVLRGYAEGYNQYVDQVLAQQSTLLPREFTEFGFEPSRLSDYDVAMIWIGTMANRFSDFTGEVENLQVKNSLTEKYGQDKGAELFDQLVWREDPTAPTTVPRDQDPAQLQREEAQARTAAELEPISSDVADSTAATGKAYGGQQWPHAAPEASNMWIVGSQKSSEGGSSLMNGPQFDWFNPSYVYGIGLHGAGIDVTGTTPFAYPSILFGTNKDISWGSTAGPLDVNDIYQEELNPDDATQYRFNGAYETMDERTETIKVKDAPDVQYTVQSTVHGVVTAADPQNHTAYSKKRAWQGTEVQSLMGWVNIMKAHSWDDYLEQAKKVGITINWYYADKEGNIGYVSPGRLPVRPENQDFRLPAKGDGSMEWQGFRPFDENPRTFNPEQGYIANWNNQSAAGFNTDSGNWSRVDRVNEIISRLGSTEKLSPQQVWDINEETSFADLNIRYLRPYLAEAVSSLPENDPLRSDAGILANWDSMTKDTDGDGNYDGPAPTIMRAWLPKLAQAVLEDDLPQDVYEKYAASIYSEPQGSVRPAEATKLIHNALAGEQAGVAQTVDLFNGEDHGRVLRQSFESAMEQVRAEQGADPGRWLTPVTPHRYKTENFMGIPQTTADNALTTHQYMNRGTQNDLVHLTEGGAGMCVAAPPGQSGYIAPDGTRSAHYQDQLELYTNFECKDENLYPDQLARHLESVTELQ